MERSFSPTPSTRDLIRSYTTSSDESAAERIAAARAARERRRQQREAPRGDPLDKDDTAHDALPRVEVHEADSQDGRSSFGGGAGEDDEEDRTTSSLVPKLRVKPTSDRSYTPSVPSSPSRSQPSSSPHASPAAPLPPHDGEHASPDGPARTSATTPRRTSFEVGDIPPFRPKSASPAPAPSSASPAATPPLGIPSRTPSPGHVTLAGGLMERLKAQRAAKLAAEAQANAPVPAPASAPPPTSEAGSSAAYTPLTEHFPAPLPEGTTPPTSPSQEPVPLDTPGVDTARPAAFGFPPFALPSSAAVEAKPATEGAQPVETVPLKARRTVPSKVFGRDGVEHDFEFTQLSDVPEQTERSSLSTWRDSVHQHRRHGSTSSAGRPVSSTFSATIPSFVTQPRRFSLASSTSSLGRQQADGSFAPPSRARSVIPSSWSARSTLPDSFSQVSEPGSRPLDPPDKRVDATSQLLGRSGSTGSIFPASSRSSGTNSLSGSSSDAALYSRSSSPPVRHPSPTRRVSPEVARRAAQFAQVEVGGPPPSPTKSALSSRSSSPVKRPLIDKPLPLPSSASSVSSLSSSLSPPLPAPLDEDPLVAIERRRHERRRAIEAFRTQLEQDPPRASEAIPSGLVMAASPPPSSSSDHAQATSFSAAGSSSRTRSPSPGRPILCEGYLRIPPSDESHVDRSAHLAEWSRRYCVLTSSGLEFRPTDQEPGVRPSTAFALSECSHVEEPTTIPLATSLRPFAVVLKDGERRYFASENRVERVKWVLALQDAVGATSRSHFRSSSSPSRASPSPLAAQDIGRPDSTRTLTPPGSRFSSTRGTVRSWTKAGPESEKALSPPPFSPGPFGLYSFADEKQRPPVARPASIASTASTSSLQYLPEKATADRGRYDRDLFGLYTSRGGPSTAIPAVARPSSVRSTGSDRSLPPLPPPKEPIPPAARPGHRRARSDLSAYNTPDDQPPFRPLPTRPSTTSATSPIPTSPQKRDLRATSTSSSYVSPGEVAALERELRDLGEKAESKEFGRVKRDERYRRVQERLKVFQGKLASASSVASASSASVRPDELALAEKVDYLLHVTKDLLEKRERAPAPRTTSASEDGQLMSRVEARIRDLLNNMDKPAPPVPRSGPSTIRARAEPDNATLTTRAGIHSPSERLEWQRDLERFKNEAAASPRAPASSAASPNTVLRERERASRKLQNLSPLSPNQLEPFTSSHSFFGESRAGQARTCDPFAGSGVVEPTEQPEPLRRTPLPAHQHMHQPQPSLRSYGEWGGAGSARSNISWAESDVSKVEQALFRILDGFEQQNGSLAQNQQHQERIAQVIGELAKWVAEDRPLRDAQFHELVGAVNGVVQHVSELPQRLLASLGAAEAGAHEEPPRPTVDLVDGGVDPATAMAATGGLAGADTPAAGEGAEVIHPEADAVGHEPKKRAFGLNPLSSFAQLDRKLAAGEAGGTGGRLKGPRMPGIRLWGAPEPVADRVNRWGGGAVAVKEAGDKQATEEALAADAEAAKGPNGPVVEALKKDEKLGQALQAIADGSGDEVDAGTLSLAVFEILQTMRDISKKQAEQEAKEKAEREKNSGLTLKEKAELEAKRGEIARLERDTAMNTERTAKINEMVAQLAMKTEKADQLLAQIAKNVADGKTTTMDPALSDEVKKLLGGVRNGVDEHVKDFRGQLTSEVQRMFKEVGKLRDEKKTLQTEIADLMAFQAKHGGAVPKAAPLPPAAAPPPAVAAKAADPPKPGLPSSGFFGPRPMK
ncbi:hypothetical protein JCM10449v2_005716 [Rhodotorula kratochvilovae]